MEYIAEFLVLNLALYKLTTTLGVGNFITTIP